MQKNMGYPSVVNFPQNLNRFLMTMFQIDFVSPGDYPDFLVDRRLIIQFECFLNDRLLPVYGKIKSGDWTYVFSFDLLRIEESDALQRTSFPLVPNSPTTLGKDRIKLVSIALAGNEVIEGSQPTFLLGKLIAESLVKYFSMQAKSPSKEELEGIFASFPWVEIEKLTYPPSDDDVFSSPHGDVPDLEW
ncbi:MAG: hypothetical protein IPN95_28115 [Bacteroidetes bacterium]|nr:hypothetical protein [Bacteroidota bacterium]